MNKQAQIDRVANDGGEGYSQAEVSAERAGLAAIKAEQARFADCWTADVLAARKAMWNSEIQRLVDARAKMTANVMIAIERKLGYTLSDIKRANALHA